MTRKTADWLHQYRWWPWLHWLTYGLLALLVVGATVAASEAASGLVVMCGFLRDAVLPASPAGQRSDRAGAEWSRPAYAAPPPAVTRRPD